MTDFELLKCLQSKLIETLEQRKTVEKWIPITCSKAKIRRLRLQIQEVMLRIEMKCEGSIKYKKEGWE